MTTILAGISATILALAPITNPIGGLAAFAGLTAARNTAVSFHVGIVLGVLITAAAIALLLRYATPWIDRLGPTGVGAIVRIMGFLILVIGVELVIHGVRALQLF